jgi:hypothetical protein
MSMIFQPCCLGRSRRRSRSGLRSGRSMVVRSHSNSRLMLSPDALGRLSTYTGIPLAYSWCRTGGPNALTIIANSTNNGSAHRDRRLR